LNPPLPEGVREIYCIRANGLRGIKRRQIAERETVRFPGNVHWWLRKEPLSGASLVIVPSRSEPFGMVILEAMELGVPVLFEASAGVGEVLKSGIPIHSEDIQGTGDQIVGLLADERRWLDVAQGQLNEMRDYSKRDYAKRVVELWAREMGAEKGQALRRLL